MSLFHTSLMSRSLAEVQAKACKTPFGGSVAFVPPSLLLLEGCLPKPRLSTNPQNCIIPSSLRPHVPTIQHFTHWLTPYRIAHLDSLSSLFPPDIIIRCRLCIANSIQPSTLSNYSSGLLRFTIFCDDYNVPEMDCMLASESLLSLFISTRGTASVGKGAMKTWLEGIRLWHEINKASWHSGRMLKRVISGAAKFAPAESSQLKHEPVTIEHLRSLHRNLDLSNLFDIAIFAIACVAFWCCCR